MKPFQRWGCVRIGRRAFTIVGLIPKLLCKMLESEGGVALVSQAKQRAGLDAAHEFQMNQVYPDEQWWKLFRAAQELVNLSEDDAYRRYAAFFIADAQQRWPMWFEMSRNAREFLERQPRIHNGFATGVHDPDDRQAINDKFSLESGEKELLVHYRSPNRMCGFYIALANEVLVHYGEKATVEHKQCMHAGAPECEILIRWT